MVKGAAGAVLAAELGLNVASDLKPASGAWVAAPRPMLPVTTDMSALLPHGGLTAVTGLTADRIGATSLLWRLLAGPTQAGAWCAVVGLPRRDPLAARAAGVDLARLALVDAEGPRIADAAAALATGLAVLVVPSAPFAPKQTVRLAARARRSGTALVWWQTRPVAGAEAHLEVARASWKGLRANPGRRYGAGRLDACELDVAARWRTGSVHRARIWPYGGRPDPDVIELRSRS